MKHSSAVLALLTCSVGLVLSACAESPAATQSAPQASATQPPPVKTCQTDYATGSHYERRTVCETAQEENQTHRETEQIISDERSLYGNNLPPVVGGPLSGGH